ncbi:MAG: alpha/beta hydrolase [Pseudomonadota bacterium]
MSESPEIGEFIDAGGVNTNYHDLGEAGGKSPITFIHGSGPGVTSFANWRLVFPEVAQHYRVLGPDMVGFGFTDRPADGRYSLDRWVKHFLDFLDALGIEKTHLVGNSFGGGLSVALAIRAPERFDRIVLMGAAATRFELTDGLDFAWGYTPSLENMRKMLDLFAYDRSLVTDELAKLRYEASLRPGVQEAYASMFPAPRQNGVNALASNEQDIRNILHEVMIVHGREDKIIPLSASIQLAELLPNAQLHVFGKCGHWTQIEHNRRFVELILNFFNEAN